MQKLEIRKAKIGDIKQIQNLINYYSKQDIMLPRSLNELYEGIRDFWVAEENKKVIGCAALHVSWEDFAEIRSLAVQKNRQKKGIGEELVLTSINEAKHLCAKRVFVLTYKPGYFKKFGFKKVKHHELPHKVWAECINCHKFPDCQEIAMIKQL